MDCKFPTCSFADNLLLDKIQFQFSQDPRTSIETLLYCLARPPAYTTVRVNTHLSSTEQVKEKLQEHLKQWSRFDFQVIQHGVLPDLLVMQNYGPLWTLEQSEIEAIVDLPCGVAVLRGADVFVPGIMSLPSGAQSGTKVSVYADLKGVCLKGATEKFKGVKLFIGNGILSHSRKDVFKSSVQLRGVGIQMVEPVVVAPQLSGVIPSLIFPQNLPCCLCGHVMQVEKEDNILDMCAAPGGKATHLATMLSNVGGGHIVALEKSKNRLQKLKTASEKLQINSLMDSYYFDATKAFSVTGGLPCGPPPFAEETFDKILLDAPCSALGQRPAYLIRSDWSSVSSHAALQRHLVKAAVHLLKVGGTMVYSTCTFNTAENEELVAWILQTYPQMILCKQEPYLGKPASKIGGLTQEQCDLIQKFDPGSIPDHQSSDYDNCFVDENLSKTKSASNNFQTLYELHRKSLGSLNMLHVNADSIGFFIAKFCKSSPMDNVN